MPQLGRFQRTVQNSSGTALSGVSVTLYREGATVNGNQSGVSPLTVTVRENGKIAALDTVFINSVSGTTYTVDSTTATTVVLSGFAGTLTLTNGDRLVPSNNLPTLYGDDQAGATTANPLTSSSTGYAHAWIAPGIYEVLYSGGSATTTLYQSQMVFGGEEVEFNVRAWGATGDGTTDDSAAINAAITEANQRSGGVVLFPRGNYKCNITLKQYVTLLGMGGRGSDASTGAYLTAFTAGTATITVDPAGDQMHIRNLVIAGGTSHCISRLAGSAPKAHITIENCTLNAGASGAGFYTEGDFEELYVHNCRFANGQYGFQFGRVAGGASNALARSTFEDCLFTGQSINGVRLNAINGITNIDFINCAVTSCQQSAWAIGSNGAKEINWIGCNTETCCLTVGNARYTTGSITAGTNSLTVADSTGYVVGDIIRVRGAATGKTDLQATVNAIAGNVLTLSGNANVTVTNEWVTRSQVDLIQFGIGADNGGQEHTFIGCSFADNATPARYLFDAGQLAGTAWIFNCSVGGATALYDYYDPNGYVVRFGGRLQNTRKEGIEFGGKVAADIAAPSVNRSVIYCRDNGAGKVQLVARFNTGAIQVIATEP